MQHQADGSLTHESLSAVKRAAARILRRERAVGASLVLCHPSGAQDTLCFGLADLRTRRPVTPETCMRLASVSKLVMSMTALYYCERGQLSLDADISDDLGFPVRSPHAPDVPVTLRMLLTHTSGICDEGSYGTRGMQQDCTLPELLGSAHSWLPHQPGSSFHYSNLGAGTAGVVIECALGMPFDDCFRQALAAPLGLHAAYDPRAFADFYRETGNVASGYSVRGLLPPRLRYDAKALCLREKTPFDPMRDYHITAGRLIADSHALGRLVRLLAGDGSVSGVRVLSPQSMDMLRRDQSAFGLGCGARALNAAYLPGVFPGIDAVGHQGVAYGMCAELFADPVRGCGVGVMMNGVRLVRQPPLMRAGFDLLALGFHALLD